MKTFLFIVSIFFPLAMLSQNDQLAQNYFDKGDFEKARISYEELVKSQPGNSYYFQRLIDTYQQLQQYDTAEKMLQQRLATYQQGSNLVELGYNFQLRKDLPKAKRYYEDALEKIKKNPSEVYSVAPSFERKALFDYALRAYESAAALDPKLSFNFQMAMLHGQLGNTDLMIDKFLNEAVTNPQNNIVVQNQLMRFITEDADAAFVETLRKALLVRAQKSQDIFWNQYLSWFYVQQKEYGKAFIQEKAMYRREPESLSNIVNLAQLSIQEGDTATAQEIFAFVLENTKDLDLQVQAHYYLLEMKIKTAQEKDYNAIEAEIDGLLKEFGISPYSLNLQILQAHFLTFNLKDPASAKALLKAALDLPLSKYQAADIKMELADILLYEEKFNQASIYYSQIEDDLKNDVVGHAASLKSAKTSYFKGDFEWAQKQFKELKSASTQLIANDALDYFLLINDNTVADSTQAALKKFARADYLLYQNKNRDALAVFQSIVKDFKGQEIEPVTLLRIGKTFEKLGDINAALESYASIIDKHGESIYLDEALYFSADIYNNLKDPEKAKPLYEKIIFSHQDSIYFVEARKKYRQLRGDSNL